MRSRGLRWLSTSGTQQEGLVVTARCAERLNTLSREKGRIVLRVGVEAGGCGGFQYQFRIENETKSDDLKFEQNGAVVVTDAASMEFLRGAIVDYQSEMMRAGFSILENPLASNKCGCGTSFSPKT